MKAGRNVEMEDGIPKSVHVIRHTKFINEHCQIAHTDIRQANLIFVDEALCLIDYNHAVFYPHEPSCKKILLKYLKVIERR